MIFVLISAHAVLPLHSYVFQCPIGHVHTYGGVHYISIKTIKDPW